MEIQKRLGAVQAEIQNPTKSTENPFYKSKYAPLPEILEMVRPLCAKHGLSIVQYPETRIETGSAWIGVRTYLALAEKNPHICKKEGSAPDPDEDMLDCGWVGIPSQALDAQKVGAVITYFRRYAIKAIFAIEAEDDDANSAVPTPDKKSGSKPAEKKMGNAVEIKGKWLGARTRTEQDAVLAEANALAWSDVDHQDLAVFFETELAKRNAPKKPTTREVPVEETPSDAADTQMRIQTEG